MEIKPDAMQAAGVSVSQLVAALQAQNLASPVGKVNGSLDERAIRLKGKLETPEDFLALVVAQKNGRTIRLGEVATARDGTEEPTSSALYNGRDAVGVMVKKSKGFSTSEVSAAGAREVNAIRATLPKGTRLDVVQNSGDHVDRSVANVEEALIEGALLTVLVVFLFLNSWRSTVITGLALPVSVLSSFIAVLAFGFTLNTMSLLGLSLAIGILIDDAIVVRENIVRHIEMGKDHFRASHDGTDEIGLAVSGDDVLDRRGVRADRVHGRRGGAVVQAVRADDRVRGARLALRLVLARPDALGVLGRPAGRGARAPKSGRARARPLQHVVQPAGRPLHARDRLGARSPLVDGARSRVGAFAGAIALQVKFGGFGFVPNSDRSELTIQVETPPGSNLAYTRMKTEEAARLARSHAISPNTRSRPSADRVPGSSRAARSARRTSAACTCGWCRRRTGPSRRTDFGELLRKQSQQIGGANVYVFTSGFGGVRKQIQVELRGADAVVLNRLADSVMKIVKSVPGAVDIGLSTKGQKPELEIALNRALAGSMGVTVGQVAQSLRPAFAGIDAGDWVDPAGQNRKVRIRLTPEARTKIADIERLPLVVGGGAAGSRETAMPLGQIATVTAGLGPAIISHLDRDNVVVVEANTQGRSLGEVNADITAKLARFPLPTGYRFTCRRRSEGPAAGVQPHVRGDGDRGAADVPDPRDAVRLVPRAARDHDLAPALAHRRRARAARSRTTR